jgi:hypothetical protein
VWRRRGGARFPGFGQKVMLNEPLSTDRLAVECCGAAHSAGWRRVSDSVCNAARDRNGPTIAHQIKPQRPPIGPGTGRASPFRRQAPRVPVGQSPPAPTVPASHDPTAPVSERPTLQTSAWPSDRVSRQPGHEGLRPSRLGLSGHSTTDDRHRQIARRHAYQYHTKQPCTAGAIIADDRIRTSGSCRQRESSARQIERYARNRGE